MINLSTSYNTIKKILIRINFKINGVINFKSSFHNRKKLNKKNVIVYSMGKVASSSIYYSFMKFYPFNRVFHNHFLSDYWMKKLKNTKYKRNIKLRNKTNNYLNKHNENINYYVVLVRDPISRDLSNIIQNYENKDIDIKNLPSNKLFQIIEKEGHDFFDEWFESEFNNYFKTNILNISFNKDLGYSIFNLNERNKILIIQLEKLNQNFIKAMKDFLNVDFDYLYNFNLSSKKLEDKIYLNLKNKYKLSDSKLEQIYSSKYVKHFYNETQLESFKNKWKI